MEVSLIRVDAVLPCRLIVRVSVPSVKVSAAIGIDTVAFPIELTVAKPVNEPPVMSEDETPESV